MNWDIPVALAAVYAALISTAALALEVRRWFETGPRLLVTAQGPMIPVNAPSAEGMKFLSLSVANRGTSPTTIKLMILHEYPTFWHRFRANPVKAAFVLDPSVPGFPVTLPMVLAPGEIWDGYVIYSEELKQWVQESHFYLGVTVSHQKRPVTARLRLTSVAQHEEASSPLHTE